MDVTGTGEDRKYSRAKVGSFPKAMLVLGEGAENPCVRRGYVTGLYVYIRYSIILFMTRLIDIVQCRV